MNYINKKAYTREPTTLPTAATVMKTTMSPLNCYYLPLLPQRHQLSLGPFSNSHFYDPSISSPATATVAAEVVLPPH